MKRSSDFADGPTLVREARAVQAAILTSFKISIAALPLVVLATFCVPLWGQEAEPIVVGNVQVTGQPEDWTHHHLVFSNPGTEDEAIRNGTHEEWLKIVNDPRYVLHQLKRRQSAQGPAGEAVAMRLSRFAESDAGREVGERRRFDPPTPIPPRRPILRPVRTLTNILTNMKSDWSQPMLTGAVQPDAFPAKYSFTPIETPSCSSDYVVYPTGSVGSATSATIIAYNNLYKTTCSTGTVPSVYWAYNTGTAAVTTSPVLSLNGTKVAFVQTSSTAASLVVLKFASSTTQTVSAPGVPTTVTNISTCTAPCMTVTSLPVSDTYSSPFYDYINDALYVGDDQSHLYKITKVFNGTATPTSTQITLNTTATVDILSPVYDSVSGCVFVGGGADFAYSVNSGFPGTVCTSSSFSVHGVSIVLGNGSNDGLFDGPLVDSTAQTVYGFITASSGATGTCPSGANCIDEFLTSTITSGSTGVVPVASASLGNGGAGYILLAGAFDNVYYQSSTPSNPSGNIYSMGNTSNSGAGTLYRVPIVNNLVQPAVTIGVVNQIKNPWPSPVTEFCNGACTSNGTSTTSGTDRIFFSVFDGIFSGTVCSNYDQNAGFGCVFAFNVSTPLAANTVPTPAGTILINAPAGNGCWATGGIIIDNPGTATGESQVYFVNLNRNSVASAPIACSTSSGNTIQAVQASQSALQ